MATKANPNVVTFVGGEVDQYTLARTDLAIHPSTAERLENVYLITQGAMELAPGTKYIGETPSSAAALLRPWVFSLDTAFCVEVSENLLRFIYVDDYVALEGGAATVGTFTDETAAAPTGGDPPPAGGGGSGFPAPDDSGYWVWVEYGEGGGGYWMYIGPGEVP